MVRGFSTDDRFGKHLVSERGLELFQGVQFQQLGQRLADYVCRKEPAESDGPLKGSMSVCRLTSDLRPTALPRPLCAICGHGLWRAEGPHQYVSLAMSLDPGDDFWPDVCTCLAPDQNSEMLQPNPNLAWILNDTRTCCWRRVDKRFD